MKRLVLLVFIAFSIQLWGEENEIPVVGLDAQGTPFEMRVRRTDYSKRMEQIISGTTDATLPALRALSGGGSWQMHTVVVGVGLNFEIGLDKIASIGVTPRMRFAFTREQDPIVP